MVGRVNQTEARTRAPKLLTSYRGGCADRGLSSGRRRRELNHVALFGGFDHDQVTAEFGVRQDGGKGRRGWGLFKRRLDAVTDRRFVPRLCPVAWPAPLCEKQVTRGASSRIRRCGDLPAPAWRRNLSRRETARRSVRAARDRDTDERLGLREHSNRVRVNEGASPVGPRRRADRPAARRDRVALLDYRSRSGRLPHGGNACHYGAFHRPAVSATGHRRAHEPRHAGSAQTRLRSRRVDGAAPLSPSRLRRYRGRARSPSRAPPLRGSGARRFRAGPRPAQPHR